MRRTHTRARARTGTRTHRLSKSLKPERGRKREDIITYTWKKNRDGGETIDVEERVGAALLPLTSCFHPLESVVFQNRGACSQVSVHLSPSVRHPPTCSCDLGRGERCGALHAGFNYLMCLFRGKISSLPPGFPIIRNRLAVYPATFSLQHSADLLWS